MEEIIRVDINDNQIGTIEKLLAHKAPILHRAFSVFLYYGNKLLLQKRQKNKYHSGGLWANACCSHQRANKEFWASVYDRLNFELGIKEALDLTELFTFTYLSKYANDLFEYEYDHVILGEYDQQKPINFNKEEIEEVKWWTLEELENEIVANPQNFATWFIICAPKVINILKEKNNFN